MQNDSVKAKLLLEDGNYTCVLCCDKEIFTSEKRGVAPLIDFLESGKDFSGFSAADRVVGNGAAFLYVLLGVKEVYAGVLSRAAKATLENSGISVTCGTLTDFIINRSKSGICPIEQAVSGIKNPSDALCAIKAELSALKRNSEAGK